MTLLAFQGQVTVFHALHILFCFCFLTLAACFQAWGLWPCFLPPTHIYIPAPFCGRQILLVKELNPRHWLLYITSIILKTLRHLRYSVRRVFMMALSMTSLSTSVGMYLFINWLLYQLSSFYSISIFLYKSIWVPSATLGCCLAMVGSLNPVLTTATEVTEWDS